MRFIALIIVSLAGFTRAEAEIIHFRMTGQITVDFALGELPDGIYEGAPFQVDLSYDTATPDSYADDPQRGLYPTAIGPNNFLRFRAGPAEVRAKDLWLWVGNDIEGNPQPGDGRPIWDLPDDSFQFQSQISANFPIAPFHSIVFEWRDSTRAALQSDALPTQLDLTAFQNTWFKISTGSLNNRDPQFTVRGVVQDIVSVPEPKCAVILAIGLLIWWWFGSTRTKLTR